MAAEGSEGGSPTPHDNGVPAGAPWSEHMRADIRALTTCDELVYLPGSDASRGATVERYVAAALGIPESPFEASR